MGGSWQIQDPEGIVRSSIRTVSDAASGGRGYGLNLSWHLWFHMASSAGLPAGVGLATLEKGLALMQT